MAREVIFNKVVTHNSVKPAIAVPAGTPVGAGIAPIGLPGSPQLQIPDLAAMKKLFTRSKGRDEHTIAIPAGMKWWGATVVTQPPSSTAAAARVWSVSGNGSGPRKVTAAWSVPPGGSCVYRIRGYATPPAPQPVETERLTIVNKQSVERLRNSLRDKDRVLVTFRGVDAAALIVAGVVDIFDTDEIFVGNVVGVDDLLIICAAIVAGVALAALTVICVVGIATGYTINVTEATLGNVFAGELPSFTLELVPPPAP